MCLLAIETATDVCSIALAESGRILAENTVYLPKRHSELLTRMIEQQLRNIQQDIDAIEGVAISIGPGSFTGLRIGLSTAKGLVYRQKTPLYAVPTLAASAWSVHRLTDRVGVLHHSHRSQYFFAVYDLRQGPELVTGPVRQDVQDICAGLDRELRLVVQAPPGQNPTGEIPNRILSLDCVRGTHLAELTLWNPDQWLVEEPYQLEPDYLKDYQAVKFKNPLKSEKGG